jgi:hypothetical protein
MPAIPQYDTVSSPSSAGLGGDPSNAGAAGRGLQQLASGLKDVTDAYSLSERRRDVAQAAEKMAELREIAATRYLEAQNNAVDDAADFAPTFAKDFDEQVAELTGTMRRGASQMVREQARDLRAGYFEKAAQFEASTAVAYRQSQFAKAADHSATALELDPTGWEAAIAEQNAALSAYGLPPDDRVRLRGTMEARLKEAAARGYAAQDPLAAIGALSKANSGNKLLDGLSAEARDRVTSVARSALVQQRVQGVMAAYDEGGPAAANRALTAAQEGMPADLKDDLMARMNSGISQNRQQRREQYVQDITGVERRIAQGTAGEGTRNSVDNLYERGALSPAEYAGYNAQIDRVTIERAKEQAAADEIAKAMHSGLPLDPQSREQRKALALSFANDVKGEQVGSPTWQATAQAYAQQTRLLPDQALAWTRQAMRSPDPKLAAAAAQFYGAVQATAPIALSELDTDSKAFASSVNSMIEAGTNPNKAVETVAETVFNLKPAIAEQRKSEYREFAKGSRKALNDMIDDAFDPGFFSATPSATANMAADFETQAGRYYSKVGDIDLARKLAWEDLTRVYGPSQVNGTGQVMAFPPERFGVTPESIRADILALIQSAPQADGSAADDIILVPDALTLRQVGDALSGKFVQPSYALKTKSGDDVRGTDGLRQRYTIPSGEDLDARFKAAQDKAAAEARALVDAARAKRAKRAEDDAKLIEQARKGALPRRGGLD